MDIFQWRRLAIRCLYISMILIVIAIVAFQIKLLSIGLAIIGTLLFAIYVGISFKYWRCPHCKEQFPVVYTRMDQRKECWHCLGKIDGK